MNTKKTKLMVITREIDAIRNSRLENYNLKVIQRVENFKFLLVWLYDECSSDKEIE